MAFMNLLKANFTGQVGQVIGSKWKNKSVIRSATFGKAPPSPAQTRNVRAFECLNRIASQYAKTAWPFLGLTAGEMHQHNRVASWLKPAIKNHVFEPWNIADVISASDEFSCWSVIRNVTSGKFEARFQYAPGFVPAPGTLAVVLVCDEFGYTYFCSAAPPDVTAPYVFSRVYPHNEIYILSFLAAPAGDGYSLFGFSFHRGINMRFDTVEQLTGDIYKDDRPIYVQVFEGALTLQPSQNMKQASVSLRNGVQMVFNSHIFWSTPAQVGLFLSNNSSQTVADSSPDLNLTLREHTRLSLSSAGVLSLDVFSSGNVTAFPCIYMATVWFTKR
jgi:hypothetical protein